MPPSEEGIEGLSGRVSQLEKRVEANHDSVVDLRTESSERDRSIGEFTVELRETREDIKSIRRIFMWLLGFSGTAAIALVTLFVQITLSLP